MRHSPSPYRLVVALLVALLALGFLQPAANAATARSLSISATPTGAVVKGAVTFSGKLSKSPKGSKVTIQRKSGKKWVTAKSTTTKTTTGAYSVRVSLPATAGPYAFRAVAAKKGTLKAAISKAITVSALRKVAATLKATPTTVTAGNNVTFTGTVRPFVKNTVVTVQRLTGTKWVALSTAVLGATGNFSKATPVLNSGLVRVSVPRAGANAPAVSPAVSITTNPAIGTTALPDATIGSSYTFTLTDKSHVPGTWTAAPLPDGLSLAPDTGVISGVPAVSAVTKQVTIGFTEITGRVAAPKVLTLTVNSPVAPTITTTSLPDAQVGVPYSQQLAATGGPGAWSTASTLPSGLTLSASGLISGTPAAVGANPVTTSIAAKFTNTTTTLSDTKSLDLTVDPPPAPVILTTSLPDGKVNVLGTTTPYSAQLHVSGDVAGTWAITGLPAGLTYNATTGLISGAPTAVLPTTANVTVDFTQQSTGAAAATKHYTIKIANVNPSPAVVVGAGGQFSCRTDSDQKLWCWGYDEAGELGDGGALAIDPPGVLKPKQVGSATDWSGVTTGGSTLLTERHACAIRGTTGYCWGSDGNGELGSAAVSGSSTSPVAIDGGLAWQQLAAGWNSTCGVTTAGALYCWGKNDQDQLGVPGGSQDTPARVGTASDWITVSAAYNHACAIKGTGTLWCWGSDTRGQLGNGDVTRSTATIPVQVGSATTWSKVTAGYGYTCALRTDGTLWCWGITDQGAIGNGVTVNDSAQDVLSPLQVGVATNWTDVAAGAGQGCAVNDGGQLWCWGKNASGQVGNNSVAAQGTPVRIGTGTDWASVSAGDAHSCAVRDTGDIWCWGANSKGQLGNNSATESHVPVAVVG